MTTSTVAAILTILGYSLYDAVIVFDRIRENAPRMPRAAFSQIVNRSMSDVLTRSLATSFCTLMPVVALLLFGGETLKDFAFALLVGIASGTYSSIFIAGPVLTEWKEREPVYARAPPRIAEDFGASCRPTRSPTAGAPATSRRSEERAPRRRQRRARRARPAGRRRPSSTRWSRDLHVDAPSPRRRRPPSASRTADPTRRRRARGPRMKDTQAEAREASGRATSARKEALTWHCSSG